MEIILWIFLIILAMPFILPWMLPALAVYKLTKAFIKNENR